MKKTLIFMALSLSFILTSCTMGEWKISGSENIEPSEMIVKRVYPQQSFDRIDIHTLADVKIVQTDGDSYVRISAPENYIDLFEFKNKHGQLDIKLKKNNVNIHTNHVKITVYTPNLHGIENNGLSNVICNGLNSSELHVENGGVGSITFSDLRVPNLKVECDGIGGITLSGRAAKAKYECDGVGSIKASGLKARYVKAAVSGVGSIDCYATEYIKGEINGIGSLKYGGHPAKKIFDKGKHVVGSISEL